MRDAVLGHGLISAGGQIAVEVGEHRGPVGGVDDVGPCGPAADQLGGCVPGELHAAVADERCLQGSVDRGPVGGTRQASHQTAQHLLAVAQGILRLSSLADVADEAFQMEEPALVVAHAHAALPDPFDPLAGHDEAVDDGPALVVREGGVDLPAHHVVVVRVDQVTPRHGAVEEPSGLRSSSSRKPSLTN